MLSKCRLALLGMVVVHGVGLIGMDTENKSLQSPRRDDSNGELAAVIAILIKKPSSLRCSDEIRAEEKIGLSNMYFGSACRGNPECYWDCKVRAMDRRKPWTPDYFPGR
jgi:hypothetical protein